MSIVHFQINSKDSDVKHVFKLDTPNSSYCIGIVDEGFVGHIYYGERLDIGNNYEDDNRKDDNHKDTVASELDIFKNAFRTVIYPKVPSKNDRDRCSFLDAFPMEYPTHGIGDFRDDAFSIETIDGHYGVGLLYDSYEIVKGKNKIPGLPTSFSKDNTSDVDTLIIHCIDRPTNLKIDLIYSAFNDVDVITRSVKVVNEGKEDIFVTRCYSACLDMDNKDFEAVTLHGTWARERCMESNKVGHARLCVESRRGESSHQDHPFMMLKTPNTTDTTGEVYAMSFVYSGNFHVSAGLDQFGSVRMLMGINDEDFRWKLTPGEEFNSPEVIMVYSNEGVGKMTRTFHDFIRQHIIRSPYKDKKRPILINNWEATYFEFSTEKLIAIAEQASKLGIEMLVMDDGWFGNRFDDNRALGDWIVNEEKLSGGLKYLVDEVNKLGMKFGIWFEPEMISPDSDLYRAHPDWAFAIPGRTPARARNQYVLDLSRRDVLDYTYESVAKILRSANIEYVKWDMNRQLTDLGSAMIPNDRTGELFHRYVLGVYELQDRLLKEFPYLLLENCSGGGARFDPGMLYFGPQIWCSDDTDAVERLSIQEGTSLVYPLSTMGAHVSDCPNHTVGRVTPFKTRGHVALAGTFGYELDVTKIPKEDVEMIPEQVAMYHKYNDLVREGDYYRIASYRENGLYDCYGVVAKDRSKALYTFVQVLNRPSWPIRRICFKGLDPEKKYVVESDELKKIYLPETEDSEELVFSGEYLMKVGLFMPNPWGDFKSELIYLKGI